MRRGEQSEAGSVILYVIQGSRVGLPRWGQHAQQGLRLLSMASLGRAGFKERESQTIFLMQLRQKGGPGLLEEDLVVCLVPIATGSKGRTREFRKGVKIDVVDCGCNPSQNGVDDEAQAKMTWV